jgi:SAM-dependent methyltransferase
LALFQAPQEACRLVDPSVTERRFASTVEHYVAGRPPYAPALIARVVQLCGVSAAHRVLDLGCGPGLLAIAFARHAGSVLAVDPEPEMLRAACAGAAAAGFATRIEFVEASSNDIGAAFGTFRLAAIGRAFHWMDRAETLRRLDAAIEPDGAVVLFGDDHPDVPDNAWYAGYRALLDSYAPGDAARRGRRSPGYIASTAFLLDSAFHQLERVGVIERRRIPVEHLVDRALSMSSTSPARLGGRARELAASIRTLATRHAEGALITEVVESIALIAKREGSPRS